MKAIALANRLARDLDEKSVVDLAADARLEILDAINGSIQRMDSLAPSHSKTTTASLYLDAPASVDIGVTAGSAEITGATFSSDQYGRTIRIAGDDIDNQVAGASSLLHPYGGATGTVSATVYSDAVSLPEPYAELVGDPIILETHRHLPHHKLQLSPWQTRNVAEPRFYGVEANAANRAPGAPAVVRFDTLPDRAYRIAVDVILAPSRVAFADLLSPGNELPVRQEHVELYLLPIARGLLTSSALWKKAETKSAALKAAEAAEAKYETLAPQTLATPFNRARTQPGY